MRTTGIAGVESIECPSCGHTLEDYDAPASVHGVTQLTARCHHCRTEQVIEIHAGRSETSVHAVRHSPWTPKS